MVLNTRTSSIPLTAVPTTDHDERGCHIGPDPVSRNTCAQGGSVLGGCPEFCGSRIHDHRTVPGRPLGDRWFDLSEEQRLKVISQIVVMEDKLSKVDLPCYGSVYYKHDLLADTVSTPIITTTENKELSLGPDVGLR